jgi:hypothetical protein
MSDMTTAKPETNTRETMNKTDVHEIANRPEKVESEARQTNAKGAGSKLLEQYEVRIAIARERFDQHPAVRALFHNPIDPLTLEAFLISFAIVGIRMTEPVEGWIRRAGCGCGELGLEHLAKALRAHAQQEANHHLLMLADARLLVERWNQARKPKLDFDLLLDLPPTPGVLAYSALHEGVISGTTPYGQLAIEYEIEMLSVTYGPRLLERCAGLLGKEIFKGLSFLSDHVALDAGHTNFNRIQLGRLLGEQPSFLSGLVAAGSEALGAYAMFLGDCLGFLRSTASL